MQNQNIKIIAIVSETFIVVTSHVLCPLLEEADDFLFREIALPVEFTRLDS